MKIEKEKFVDSGINFIYDLDEFPRVCVEKQITQEFNEVLELNDPAVLQKRNAYFGVGSTTDYLNKLIKTSAGGCCCRHQASGRREEKAVCIYLAIVSSGFSK